MVALGVVKEPRDGRHKGVHEPRDVFEVALRHDGVGCCGESVVIQSSVFILWVVAHGRRGSGGGGRLVQLDAFEVRVVEGVRGLAAAQDDVEPPAPPRGAALEAHQRGHVRKRGVLQRA